ncbi:MAG: signal recognition particle-docking protein FtsY [Acidobacteria bacterium]|nr:signal recognition particle-docking protein FtsY [Acidobacteriota bacterium]
MIQTLFGPPEATPGFLERLREAVQSTRSTLVGHLEDLVQGKSVIDATLLEELEEVLIAGDVGSATTQEVMGAVRQQVNRGQLKDAGELKGAIKEQLLNILQVTSNGVAAPTNSPVVILVVGVNGTGKTTTIGKLAYLIGSQNKKVLLCAGDTFRAAAVEQLEIWGQRTQCEIIKQRPGADPSAVLFDALTSAKARQFDYVIADTAGRLHTKVNLMAELEKMCRTSQRVIPGSPHEVLLVLDATTGQNGLQQARQFTERAGVTGVALTKLDGTAKGGVVLAIARELKLPIRYIGVGEQKEDLLPFDPEQFIESLFS